MKADRSGCFAESDVLSLSADASQNDCDSSSEMLVTWDVE